MSWRRLAQVTICLLLWVGGVQGARITDKLLAGLYETPDASSKPMQVLPSDTPLETLEQEGDFTRVRLGDGTEGWVESRFITDEKSSRIMLLELQAKNSQLQQQLRDAKRQLKQMAGGPPEDKATGGQADPSSSLQQALADAKAEIAILKERLANRQEQTEDDGATKQRLQELEQALAEAKSTATRRIETLQQSQQALKERLSQIAELAGPARESKEPATETLDSGGISLSAWHLPALGLALLFSFIAGVAFKNHRLAKRYGGFRI